ncbi:hypothetical protein [Demequina aurantiaca]|uniref:hypothetical protein n=1 Tax=Demequina aurantiaca TaxID=676200 RepID=UPI003D334BBB
MIPTMIIFGLLAGRWWKSALVVGTVGWVAVLLTTGVIEPSETALIFGAAFFGLANTCVGVALHQGTLRLVKSVRSSRLTAELSVPAAGSA